MNPSGGRGGFKLSENKRKVFGGLNTANNAVAADTKSVPTILARKRKSEALVEQDQLMFDCQNIPDENMENNDNSSASAMVQQPFGSYQNQAAHSLSSRVPLSTVHSRNNIPKIHPSDQQILKNVNTSKPFIPKFSLDDNFSPEEPVAKKFKMRPSWSQFREFTLSGTQNLARSKTPIPSLNWANKQQMWDLICKKETGMYIRKTGADILQAHPQVQPRMRTILLDWLIEVCEVHRQHRETFYLAVDFIDRYLSVTRDIPKNRLQLIGVTCLFMGSKIEEIYPPKLSDFAYVTDGACIEEEILNMELVILKALNWGLLPMTPNAWMRMYMQISKKEQIGCDEEFASPKISGLPFSRAMQLMDLVTMDIGSLSFRYSVLAASGLCLLQNKQVALKTSGYNWSDIVRCVEWMTPFYKALIEEAPIQMIKNFPSISIDNWHNIQTHTFDISVLDRGQELASQGEFVLSSPGQIRETSITTQNVEMTPPTMDTDMRFTQSQTFPFTPNLGEFQEYLTKTPKLQTSSSVFCTPGTPVGIPKVEVVRNPSSDIF